MKTVNDAMGKGWATTVVASGFEPPVNLATRAHGDSDLFGLQSRPSDRDAVIGLKIPGADPVGGSARSAWFPAPSVRTCGHRSNTVLLVVQDAEMRGLLGFGLKQQGFDVLEDRLVVREGVIAAPKVAA